MAGVRLADGNQQQVVEHALGRHRDVAHLGQLQAHQRQEDAFGCPRARHQHAKRHRDREGNRESDEYACERRERVFAAEVASRLIGDWHHQNGIQDRVGELGRVFVLYKFRSMRPDAEKGTPVWAMPKGPGFIPRKRASSPGWA